MKKRIALFLKILFAIFIAIFFAVLINTDNLRIIYEYFNAKPLSLISVEDGDTIVGEINGETLTIRLIGINSPEFYEPYYKESRDVLISLVSEKDIKYTKDISERDKHGRILCYVFADDIFVNLELVKLGYAKTENDSPNLKYKDILSSAEKKAQKEKKGIWSK